MTGLAHGQLYAAVDPGDDDGLAVARWDDQAGTLHFELTYTGLDFIGWVAFLLCQLDHHHDGRTCVPDNIMLGDQ